MIEIKINRPLQKNKVTLLTISGILLITIIFLGIRISNQQYLPVDPNNETPVEIYIPDDASAHQVAAILEENELIRSQRAFLSYCRRGKLDTRLKPGYYIFNRSQALTEIAHDIAEGRVVKIKLTIPEGYNVEEIGTMLVEKQLCSEKSWQEAINAEYPYEFLKNVPKSNKYQLEGFLFPDTYYIGKNTEPEKIINMMLENFTRVWNKDFASQARAKNMDIYETIILASLIEKEAMYDDERRTIAGVINNRLRAGMYLQLCPTVLYCFDSKKTKLNNADLEIDSPYNTYRNPGLPPGPITNPGKASIDAALNPEETPYYFYVSKGDGSHYFSRTYEEHLQAMAQYIQ